MIFHNKKVAIISHAPHIVELDQKELIESYDVVVRINVAFPIPKKIEQKTSSRCDVLYVWRKVRPRPCWNKLKEIRLKPDAIFADDWDSNKYKPYAEKINIVHPDLFYKLSRTIKTRVNTGLMAICDILREGPKELYITGFNFYQEGAYYKGYVSDVRNTKLTKLKGNFASHRQDPQLDYFKRFIYNKVKCDDVLNRICSN